MSPDFPIQAVLAPAGALAVVGLLLVNRKRTLKATDAQYQQYRAGALADRLGLTLKHGDPMFNLFIRQANADVLRGPSDGKPVNIEIAAEGESEGLPVTLLYTYRVEQKTGVGKVTWRTWFDCRLAVLTHQSFAPFEVVSKTAPMGPIARTMNLPKQATVDGTYEIYAGDAAVAEALRAVLPSFATFGNSGIHLVGDGEAVSFVMKQDKAPLLANALYFAEDMKTAMVAVARAVGG